MSPVTHELEYCEYTIPYPNPAGLIKKACLSSTSMGRGIVSSFLTTASTRSCEFFDSALPRTSMSDSKWFLTYRDKTITTCTCMCMQHGIIALATNTNVNYLAAAVTHTWQSQDACALSRHSEPCKQSSWSGLWTRRRTDLSSQQMGWIHETRP